VTSAAIADVNKVAAAAAMAKRPNVRFVIMGCISVFGFKKSETTFSDRERIGLEKPTK
jgi:hypothetical protein